MKTSTSILVASTLAYQAAATNTTTLFGPIADIRVDRSNIKHVTPGKNVTMLYGNNITDDNSLVNITIDMNYPTVILENIDAVTTVECSDDSVTVIFNDTASYRATLSDWYADGDFVLITNHLGDCDAELERGFFFVEKLTWDNTSLLVTASASRANITNTASTAAVTFGGIPAASTSSKKRSAWDPSYTITNDLALPDNDVLYTLTDYLEVIADEVSLDTSLTFSGYLEYNFWAFKVSELYFDLNVTSALDIAITAEVLAAYSTTFTYASSTLSASIVSVPGILTIGPALTFLATADISADAPVNISVSTSVGLNDASVHLDLLDESNTSADGWNPSYTASAEISGEAEATLNPSVSLTVEIQIEFLSGLVDLSSGLTATPGFTNSFTLQADEVVTVGDGNVTVVSIGEGGACGDGLEVVSGFGFDLIGFVREFFSRSLYNITVPIADECWT